MQILHPFCGSLQQYTEAISDPDHYRLDHCPQCGARQPMLGHGFYGRTLVDVGFEGSIRVRRYLCRSCRRTVSLLPEFALPYLRFSIPVISLSLVARLLEGRTLVAAAVAAVQLRMPYQRSQFWVRRFRRQAEALGAALAARITPMPAATVAIRALLMLQSLDWIAAHRFLFSELRLHLLGWPRAQLVRYSATPTQGRISLCTIHECRNDLAQQRSGMLRARCTTSPSRIVCLSRFVPQ